MTDEEKKAIDFFRNRIKQCEDNANICDENDYDEEAEFLRNEKKYTETILNLLGKQDNRIKELESDKEIKDKMIDDMVNWIYELFKARPGTVSKAFNYEVCISDDCDNINREVNCDYCIKQYFENLAKEKCILFFK